MVPSFTNCISDQLPKSENLSYYNATTYQELPITTSPDGIRVFLTQIQNVFLKGCFLELL